MKAILLEAGRGTRISRSVGIPKSTLPIGDQSIVEHSVRLLIENGIDVVVVTGYMEENVRRALSKYPVKFYYNPFFAVTNSAGSLWMARDELDGDVIIGNADVFWEQPILDILLDSKKGVTILGDKSRTIVGDYFFKLKDGKIVDHGKTLEPKDRDCEYVGLCMIRSDIVKQFKDNLDDLNKKERYDRWWENALYDYRDDLPIKVADVGGLFWSEVDYYSDYESILEYIDTGDSSVKLRQPKIGK